VLFSNVQTAEIISFQQQTMFLHVISVKYDIKINKNGYIGPKFSVILLKSSQTQRKHNLTVVP